VASRSMTLLQRTIFTVAFVMTSAFLKAEEKQPMTPEACTSMRYLASDVTSLSPLQMSPDGTEIAYVLQVPDLRANDNKETLYVSAVNATASSLPVSVLTDPLITASHWFPDNKTLAVLTRRNGKIVLEKIDSATKEETLIWAADGDITDYSMNATGDVIAIGVRANNHIPSIGRDQRDESKGYRLDSESTDHSDSPRRNVYILRRVGGDRWTLAQQVDFTSPLTGKMINDFDDYHASHISLSPNGRYLLIDDFESFSNIPPRAAWEHSPLVHYMRTSGFKGPVISYLYDIRTGSATIPLDSPYVSSGIWAPDSKSFIKVAAAPAGSKWEASDFRSGSASNHDTHMFAVDVATGAISEVLHRAETAPLAWRMDGDLVVRNSSDALVTLKEEGGIWRQLSTQQIPFPDTAPYSAISSDGDHVVMEYENTRTAPRLVAFDLHSSHTWNVAELDPQADDLILPQTETVSWTTPSGFTAKGMLLLPPNYDPHIRYPLVIEDGSILYYGEFVCDSGDAHVSSFARGILADAGVAYLMRFWPGNDTWENTYYSKTYPGQLAEAAFKQELVDSAVTMLTKRQIIDPTRVGLIGFSRGGWYVEYALTHSQIPIRAASATDGSQYSIGEYYLWHDKTVSATLKTMYGGPPYGSSLNNWLKYSISFNMDKVHTPLLIEVMGRGKKAENSDNLDTKKEVFDGLSDLKKPVELYYYPDEQHQADHPKARIASLQRNVDWFRFWLQGYERPNPEDPDQYKRWEHQRELQDAQDKSDDQSNAVSPH
jgi:dipeptidyl aminopeptidase/acylaminoacyl peptidase